MKWHIHGNIKIGCHILGLVGVASQGDDFAAQLVIPLDNTQDGDGLSQALAVTGGVYLQPSIPPR